MEKSDPYWNGKQNSTGAASTGPIWNQGLDFAIRRPAQGTLEFGVVAEIPGSCLLTLELVPVRHHNPPAASSCGGLLEDEGTFKQDRKDGC